jgi:mono/diheme cytochrome c family protein
MKRERQDAKPTTSSNHIIMEEMAMTKVYRGAVVLASLAMVWGWSSMPQPVAAAGGDAAKGKSIFQSKCVSCHGTEGKGDGPVGKALKPPAGDFTSAESKKKSPDELQKIIENGVPKTAMVAWKKQLNETEMQDVLAYVLTLRK